MSDLNIFYPLLFPWDVIYHIVDVLGSDVRVLLQLALVCSNLLPRCRRHLFCAIRFEMTRDDIDSLCNFLEANLQLPPRVRQVSVYPTCDVGRRRQFTGFIFPSQLIWMIPHLSRWKFCGGFYDDLRRLVFHPKTLAYMRTTVVQHLELSFVGFISQAEMLRFLSSFPLLRSLRFSHECFQTPLNRRLVDPVTRRGPWPQLRLRSLSIMVMPDNDTVRRLIQLSRTSLEELQIAVPEAIRLSALGYKDDPEIVGSNQRSHVDSFFHEAINQNMPSFQHLRLRIPAYFAQGEFWQGFETVLSELVAHEKLKITCEIRGGRPNTLARYRAELERAMPTLSAQSRLKVECAAPYSGSPLGHDGSLAWLAISPDSRWIATASNTEIMLWDAQARAIVHDQLTWSHAASVAWSGVTLLLFAPNSRQLASCTADSRVRIWDIKDGECLAMLDIRDRRGSARECHCTTSYSALCAWSIDGGKLAACTEHPFEEEEEEEDEILVCIYTAFDIKVWNMRTYDQIFAFRMSMPPNDIFHSPDDSWWGLIRNRRLVTLGAFCPQDGYPRMQPHRSSAFPGFNPAEVNVVTFSSQPSEILVATKSPHGDVCIVNIQTEDERTLCRQCSVDKESASRFQRADRPTRAWDLANEEWPGNRMWAKNNTGAALDISPDSKLVLAIRHGDYQVDILDALSGDWLASLGQYEVHPADRDPPNPLTARFSPDGRYVAVAFQDGTVRLLSTADWSCVGVLAEHSGAAVTWVAFSPDGELLVSGAEDGTVCIRKGRGFEAQGWIQAPRPADS